jgi:hypothetical protein
MANRACTRKASTSGSLAPQIRHRVALGRVQSEMRLGVLVVGFVEPL